MRSTGWHRWMVRCCASLSRADMTWFVDLRARLTCCSAVAGYRPPAAPQEGRSAWPMSDYPALSGRSRKPAQMRLASDMTNPQQPADILCYQELGEDGPSTIEVISQSLVASVGDVVLGRKGQDAVAYHLACVIDDARQGISHVIRGQDLSEATQIHVVLQKLLGLQTPVYCHHRLIRDETGKRLAKRSDAQAIAKLRDDGMSPQDIRRLVGL